MAGENAADLQELFDILPIRIIKKNDIVEYQENKRTGYIFKKNHNNKMYEYYNTRETNQPGEQMIMSSSKENTTTALMVVIYILQCMSDYI